MLRTERFQPASPLLHLPIKRLEFHQGHLFTLAAGPNLLGRVLVDSLRSLAARRATSACDLGRQLLGVHVRQDALHFHLLLVDIVLGARSGAGAECALEVIGGEARLGDEEVL